MLNNKIVEVGDPFSCPRWFEFITKQGEKVTIEIAFCSTDPLSKKNLPYIWFKKKLTDRLISNFLSVKVYVDTLKEGCVEKYNPTVKYWEDETINYITRKPYKITRSSINFDWHLEATEDNMIKILNEIYRLAN